MKPRANDAVDQLPVRLMMSLAIVAAVILLFTASSTTLRTMFAEQAIEAQCRRLESSLSTLAQSGACRDVDDAHAAEGTKRVQTFTLPDSLVYLSFGGDPDPFNTGRLTSTLLNDGAVIVYQVQGGSKHIIWLPLETSKFRAGTFIDDHWVIEGAGHNVLIRTGGTVTLVFERVQKNHDCYILVHTMGERNKDDDAEKFF
jgi:hypothetical protein